MKSGLHPENYRLVAFKDMSNDNIFITKSTAETKETIKVEGVEYPLVKLEISRTSHPYYTGKSKLVDTAGRIDKFKNRYASLTKKEDNKENQTSIEEEPKIKSDVDSTTLETIDVTEPSEVNSKNNDEASVSDKPKDESSSDESPSDESSSDESPSDESSSDESPSDESPSDESSSDESPSDESSSDESPSEDESNNSEESPEPKK